MLTLLVYLVVFALIWWLVDFLPIQQPFNKLIKVVLVVLAILWLLSLVGGPRVAF
jgi:hypothetical protein